ncbi:MAG: radical SAM protein, partial [Muribaculaceae bacterium]|nr:radical SAM protein [Muribaculaceae bacterium]
KGTFFDLARALDEVDGIERYRISSIEPDLLTDDTIRFVAESKRFMPHFHIPLQSGNDEVLRLMRRHYDRALFADKISRIREVMPDAFIGVDLITGMRGETPERFEDSYEFIAGLDITRLHVFTYSERPNTQALNIDYVVSPQERHERTRRMMALSDRKLSAFIDSALGETRPVLFEHTLHGATMHGFTDNYLRVEVDADPLLFNTVVPVQLVKAKGSDDTIIGKLP